MSRYIWISLACFLVPFISVVSLPLLVRAQSPVTVLPWQFISAPTVSAMHVGEQAYTRHSTLVIDWQRHGWLVPQAPVAGFGQADISNDLFVLRVKKGFEVVVDACLGGKWVRQRHVGHGLIPVVGFSFQYCHQSGPF